MSQRPWPIVKHDHHCRIKNVNDVFVCYLFIMYCIFVFFDFTVTSNFHLVGLKNRIDLCTTRFRSANGKSVLCFKQFKQYYKIFDNLITSKGFVSSQRLLSVANRSWKEKIYTCNLYILTFDSTLPMDYISITI